MEICPNAAVWRVKCARGAHWRRIRLESGPRKRENDSNAVVGDETADLTRRWAALGQIAVAHEGVGILGAPVGM